MCRAQPATAKIRSIKIPEIPISPWPIGISALYRRDGKDADKMQQISTWAFQKRAREASATSEERASYIADPIKATSPYPRRYPKRETHAAVSPNPRSIVVGGQIRRMGLSPTGAEAMIRVEA